jgi:hypothetical protein
MPLTSNAPRTIDLAIPLDGLDTVRLLADWRWLVPEDFHPIHLSKFGHWFFASPDGRIHHLNIIEGSLLQVAKSRGQFEAMREDEQIRNDWLQASLVLQCDAKGLLLKPSECYGWRVHPMVGGKIELENIQVFSLGDYQALIAQSLPQWKNPKPVDSIPNLESRPTTEQLPSTLQKRKPVKTPTKRTKPKTQGKLTRRKQPP